MVRLRDGLAPLRYAAYRRFLGAQAVSGLGTAAMRVTLIWYVLQVLHGGVALGLVLFAFTAPQFLVGVAAGVLADRYSRKAIVVLSDLFSAVIFAAMYLLAVNGMLTLPPLIALLLVAGVSTSIFQPAATAMIPQLVAREPVREANALKILADQLAGILGPVLAGLTLPIVGVQTWLLLNGVSFLLAAILFLPATVPPVEKPGRETGRRSSLVRDLKEGVKLISRSPWLRSGVLAGAIGNLLLVAPLMVLIPITIQQRSMGPGALGLYFTAFSIGTVTGSVTGMVMPDRRRLDAVFLGLIVSGVLCLVLGLFPTLFAMLVLGCGIGIGIAVFDVLWDTYEQVNVADSILARVLAGDGWLSFVARSASYVLIGALGTVNPSLTLAACGGILTVVVILLLGQAREGAGGTTRAGSEML